MFSKSTAVRQNVKLKIGMAGPSGSGKTYSALQLAYGITGDWKKIAVADTENKSALYYASMGPWEHIPFDPDQVPRGYHPENWVKLIRQVEADPTCDVLILDSISHEWEGKGGCLQIQEQLGGRYQDWAKVTPLHTAFIDAIRLSRLHVIGTMRSKQDYAMEKNEKGRTEVTKVGLKTVQREGTDYEFGIVFDVAMNHFAKAGKDRTGLFAGRGDFKITPEHGKELVAWATSGAEAPFEIPFGSHGPEEVYTEANTQKGALVKAAKPHGIAHPVHLAQISKGVIGSLVSDIDVAVTRWLEKHKGELANLPEAKAGGAK